MAWIVGTLPAALGLQTCPSARWLHVACPGCGMTRAMRLFLAGDVRGAFVMHPLAVPIVAATCLVALVSIVAVLVRGSPLALTSWRAGRAAIALFVAVNAASVVVWALRCFGMLGGPVPV